MDASYGGWTRPDDPKDPAELWKKNIADRVKREAPLPTGAADRQQLIRRVTLDLFGVPPTAAEIAAFLTDKDADALAKLITRLQAMPRPDVWTGKLPTSETKFQVTAADPDGAKKPRTANSPGRFVLSDHVHLLVSQTTTDSQRTNKAIIAFLSPDPKVASPYKPYEIALPDGLRSYGIVWERGSGSLWVMQKGVVCKYDLTNPKAVKETRITPGTLEDLPISLREPLRKVFDVPGATTKQDPPKPKEGASARP